MLTQPPFDPALYENRPFQGNEWGGTAADFEAALEVEEDSYVGPAAPIPLWPQPAQPARDATPAQAPLEIPTEEQVRILRDLSGGAYLNSATGGTLRHRVQPDGFQAFYDAFMQEVGVSGSPLERMLAEQMLLVHHRIGNLCAYSAKAVSPSAIRELNSAIARLMTEYRRHLLALKAYRTPQRPAVNLIGQQNVVADDQQVAIVQGGNNPAGPSAPGNHNTELTGNSQALEYVPHDNPLSQPAASRSRSPEPDAVQRRNATRPSKAAADCADAPAVATLDRTMHGRRERASAPQRKTPADRSSVGA